MWISFRIAIVIAASLAGLSSEGAEATEPSVSNSQVVHERLVSNQEFNSLEENDQQVILDLCFHNTSSTKFSQFPFRLKLTAPVRKKAKRYYRIYEKVNHLRFELEMRQECFKYCLNSFFSYSFEEFEDELVGIFLVEFRDLCPENSKYSFWLLGRLRRKSSLPKLKNLSLGISKAIVSPYNLNFCKDLESSFKCLQLVSFLQREEIQKDLSFVNSINIAIVEFPITNFLRFIGKNPRNTYHREKSMSFFLNLLELEPRKVKINDNKFVAFTFCHWVGLEKRKNTWFIELRVAANILSWIYPYTLSDTLLIYKKKSELEINSQFIESFNTKNSWKEFEIDKTYKNLSLSNLAIERRQSVITPIAVGIKIVLTPFMCRRGKIRRRYEACNTIKKVFEKDVIDVDFILR